MSSSIADREAELAALQSAFDEYIVSSRELEEELDAELAKMQEKLAESSAANAALSSQLENLAPQLSSLERALTDTRSKLDREEKLRRQAEQAQDEAEAKLREAEGDLVTLKDECDILHEELAFKESELEETRLELEVEKERHRVELQELENDLSVRQRTAAAEPPEENGKSHTTATDSTRSEDFDDTSLEEKGSDDYVKRLEDELEIVTEQLIDAEQRLTRTEEELQDAKQKYERLEHEQAQQQRNVPDSSETVRKLEEENQLRLEEEHKLREEIGLVQEELLLTQEELKASEEDVGQFEKKLETIRAEHRDEVNQLQSRLDQAETEARTAVAEVDTLEKTMAAATEETVRLRTEISNLEAALKNAKKDQDGLVEELEAVNERFDASRQEAEKSAADRVREEIKTETDKTIAELQEKINSLSDTNSKLQAQLDEAETTLAAARDQHSQQDQDSVAAHSELVEKLQSQLARTKEALDLKGQEMDELRSTFEGRVTQAEANVSKLEKELSTTKGKLAEAEANLIVIRREKQMAAGNIPKQKGKLAKASAIASVRKVERSSSQMSVDSRDDVDLDRSMVETQSFSRRLRSVRRRRARSTSPTTPQRLIYRVEEEEKKTETLKQEYDSLKDQNRMEEVRAKRLEEDLKVLQTQLFSASGDTAVVPQQMSRISTLASPEKGGDALGDIRDVGESRVEELILSGDSGAIADELRRLDKKSAKQREYNAQLLSKILSLQGNIQVYCRVRPMRISEIKAGNKNVVEALSETEIGCYDQRTNKWKSFGFDRVWGPDQSQNSVFQDVEPLALSVVDGYNACIFAYGQTGSGKTYTMEGSSEGNQYGISYRTIQKIFHLLNLRAQQQKAAAIIARSEGQDDIGDFEFSLELGMLEIYNDEVYDLLTASADGVSASAKKREARKNGEKATLDIRRSEDGRIEVPGLRKEPVGSITDVMNLLRRGNANRATASTDLNEHSSRSHMILAVDVKSGINGQPGNNGTLYLVDLAGSERVRKSNVEGEQLKEAGYINKSLAALGNVMEALDRKSSHVPYRDSKLTYLLQDSLGGNSRTMMVVAVCPMDVAFDESIHALKFATRVRRIQLGAAQRNVTSKNLEETVKSLTSEMKKLTKAKEKSEHQLHSLKRDNTRIQDRLANLSESRAKAQTDHRSLEVLRKNNTEMANRWQKEKSRREESSAELSKCRDELRDIQQQLAKATRERDTLSRKLEEKETLLSQSSKDLRRAKDASSAATLRARTAQIMSRARTPGHSSLSSTPTKSSPSKTPRSSSRTLSPAATPAEVARIRQEVLDLLEKYDKAKLDRIDIIMEKFKGKEHLLLDKMRDRYENGGGSKSGAAVSMQRRSEMALARHKERMQKVKDSQ